MSEFTLANIGPKKFGLYGFICEVHNKNCVAYIKNVNSWNKYIEVNKAEKYDIGWLREYCPHMAICKGI